MGNTELSSERTRTLDPEQITVRLAEPPDAAVLAEALSGQLRETRTAQSSGDRMLEAFTRWIDEDLCLVAETDAPTAAAQGHRPVGVLQLDQRGEVGEVRSVIVAPGHDHEPIDIRMLTAAVQVATDLGCRDLVVRGWAAHPSTRSRMHALLVQHGYRADGPDLVRTLPVRVEVPTTEAMWALGRALVDDLRAGDVIVASGDLGAGKTTLAQGIGEALGVREPVISPTFVLVRRHAGVDGRPGLVHVDAYRLGSLAELVDLDLDETMDSCVTLVEWGAGIAEDLERSYLAVDIVRSEDPADDTRTVYLDPVGPRWEGVDLTHLVDAVASVPAATTDKEQ
ncbi:tRNA (adenosine(37)-N6)-threonylcarbamoyltransferase complex ATPase subunit type 1 TsaE [Acidipropionibacterium timonense]|uniref:tRNA (adenosine(37)-N6)-threonylcarbamoyltransferase complex ATPase subunit type 1 TsaE n=1 Tax=Acidipropionibacterium timonense TaxID=2161818 RepID=UPI003159CCD1